MLSDTPLTTSITSKDSSSLEESLSSSEKEKQEQTNAQSSPRMQSPPVARHGQNPASSHSTGSQEATLTSSPPTLSRRGHTEVMQGVWISDKYPELKSSWNEVLENNAELKGDALDKEYIKKISIFLLGNFEKLIFNLSEDRFNFLKKIATNQPRLFAQNFQIFGLKDEAQKLELAKCCGPHSMSNFSELNLDKSSHLPLAKFLSRDEEGAISLASCIYELDIPREEDRIALAKACVLSNNLSISGYIDNFNITDEFVISELALMYFKAYESASVDYLENFKLTNFEYQRRAVLAATKCVNSATDFNTLKSYVEKMTPAIGSNDLLIELIINFSSDPAFETAIKKAVRKIKSDHPIADLSHAAQAFVNTESTMSELIAVEQGKVKPATKKPITDIDQAKAIYRCELILEKLQAGEVSLNKIFSDKFIKDAKNEMPESLETLQWMRSVCFLIQKNNPKEYNESHISKLLQILQPAIMKIAVLNDKNYRGKLSIFLLNVNPEVILKYESKKISTANRLPILLNAPISTTSLESYMENLPRDFFGNGRNQRRFIECILDMQSSSLPSETVIKILEHSFQNPDTNSSSSSSSTTATLSTTANSNSSGKKNKAGKSSVIKKISVLSKDDLLKDFNKKMQSLSKIRTLIEIDALLTQQLAEGILTLPEAIRDLVMDNLNVKPSEYPKFEALFDSYRDPVTIITYLGSIRYNPAIKTLQRFVRALLEDRYPACRYENDNLLKSLGESKLNLWKANVTQPFISINSILKSKWNLAFTDEHEDVVRMGSDVKGSCQRVDGESRLNRGLMGTVMDGKHKICVIKNEEGVIVGRTVLRLMSAGDPEKSTNPCLMMEKIYPTDLGTEETTQLLNFAKQQAQRMDLGLVVSSDVEIDTKTTAATACNTAIYSGKLAYPVYCDALTGMKDEAYVIEPSNDKPLQWLIQLPSASASTSNSFSMTSSSSTSMSENV